MPRGMGHTRGDLRSLSIGLWSYVSRTRGLLWCRYAGLQDLITAIMERMAGDVEKREVSTGGNGREAESERLIPIRQIIGTTQGQGVYRRGRLHTGAFAPPICRSTSHGKPQYSSNRLYVNVDLCQRGETATSSEQST